MCPLMELKIKTTSMTLKISTFLNPDFCYIFTHYFPFSLYFGNSVKFNRMQMCDSVTNIDTLSISRNRRIKCVSNQWFVVMHCIVSQWQLEDLLNCLVVQKASNIPYLMLQMISLEKNHIRLRFVGLGSWG